MILITRDKRTSTYCLIGHDSVAFMWPRRHCQCVTVLICLETVTTSTAWPAVYPMQWATGARMRLCRCGTSELLSSASLLDRDCTVSVIPSARMLRCAQCASTTFIHNGHSSFCTLQLAPNDWFNIIRQGRGVACQINCKNYLSSTLKPEIIINV